MTLHSQRAKRGDALYALFSPLFSKIIDFKTLLRRKHDPDENTVKIENFEIRNNGHTLNLFLQSRRILTSHVSPVK